MTESFLEALKERVLLFDGAMGTEIQGLGLSKSDFPEEREGFNDGLTISHPEWIQKIHQKYLEAGADCIETNTFGSNRIKLDEYGFGDKTTEFNCDAARMARDAASMYDGTRYVVGSMGPTGYLPSTEDADLGGMPLDSIEEAFYLQARGLLRGGVDALLIETSQDILEVKLAIAASQRAIKESGGRAALIANATLDQYGKMLLGTDVQSAYTTASSMGIDVFGLNCSTGPLEMAPSIRWLGEHARHPLLVVPNAGMPENDAGRAVYGMAPGPMAGALADYLSKYGGIRIIGGCCGTTPEHIREMRRVLDA